MPEPVRNRQTFGRSPLLKMISKVEFFVLFHQIYELNPKYMETKLFYREKEGFVNRELSALRKFYRV